MPLPSLEEVIEGGSSLPTPESASSQFKTPKSIAFEEIPGIAESAPILQSEGFRSGTNLSALNAYDRTMSTLDKITVDADTYRGQLLGTDDLLRLQSVNAVEDPAHGLDMARRTRMALKDYTAGMKATETAKLAIASSIAKGERPSLLTAGERGAYGRELVNIVGKGGQFPVDKAVLEGGYGLLYGTSPEVRDTNKDLLAAQFNRSRDPNLSDEEREMEQRKFEQMLKSSEKNYIGERWFRDATRSGMTSPADYSLAITKGLMNFGEMFINTGAYVNQGLADIGRKYGWNEELVKELQAGADKLFQTARESKETREGILSKMQDRYGFLNDRDADRHGIDKYEALKYNFTKAAEEKDPGALGTVMLDIAMEGMPSIVESAPELTLGSSVGGASVLALVKAAEMTKEKYGKDAGPKEFLMQLPQAAAYAGLNRLELSVLGGSITRGLMKKGMPKSAVIAMGIPASMATEAIAEAGQTYLEKQKIGDLSGVKEGESPWTSLVPSPETKQEMATASMLAAGGVGGPMAISSSILATKEGAAQAKRAAEKGIGIVSKKIKKKKQSREAKKTSEELASSFDKAMDEYKDALKAERKGKVTNDDVLFQKSDMDWIDQLKSKLEGKKERYEKLKSEFEQMEPGSLQYVKREVTLKNMEKEIPELESEIADYEADPVSYINKRFGSYLEKRGRKMSADQLADMKARRLGLIDEIDSVENPTPKQRNYRILLESEIRSIDKVYEELYGEKQETKQESKPSEPMVESPKAEETKVEEPVAEEPVKEQKVEALKTVQPERKAKRIKTPRDIDKVDTVIAFRTREKEGTRYSDDYLKIAQKAADKGKEVYVAEGSSIKRYNPKTEELEPVKVIQPVGKLGVFGSEDVDTDTLKGVKESIIDDLETETKQDTYEVSTRGDRRFSALNARLKDGRTIEQAYQQAKGTGKGRPAKDPNFDYWGTYLGLWRQWAKENPDLIEELERVSRGKKLSDSFAKTENNQARALTVILDEYRKNLNKTKEFATSTDDSLLNDEPVYIDEEMSYELMEDIPQIDLDDVVPAETITQEEAPAETTYEVPDAEVQEEPEGESYFPLAEDNQWWQQTATEWKKIDGVKRKPVAGHIVSNILKMDRYPDAFNAIRPDMQAKDPELEASKKNASELFKRFYPHARVVNDRLAGPILAGKIGETIIKPGESLDKLSAKDKEHLLDVVRRRPASFLAKISASKKGTNIEFDPDFVASMMAAGLGSIFAMQGSNARLEPGEISKKYGVSLDDAIKIQGTSGVEKNVIVRQIGFAVMDSLGIELNKAMLDEEVSLRDQMAIDIGALFVRAALKAELIEDSNIDLDERTLQFYRINSKYEHVIRGSVLAFNRMAKEWSKPPKTSKPKKRSEMKMRKREGFIASKNKTDAANARSQVAHYLNMDLFQTFEALPDELKRNVLSIKNDDEVQVTFKENNKARSNAIWNQYLLSKSFLRDIRNKPFYFTESYGGSGRLHVDQIAGNRQQDKFFSRHMITPFKNAIPIKGDGVKAFMSAVLMSVGEKTEYLRGSKLIKAFNTFRNENRDKLKQLLDFAENRKLTDANREGVIWATELAKDEESMYTFQAMIELARADAYIAKNGTLKGFRTKLEGEIDGVTNGLAFLLFQAGETNTDLFRKVGVVFENDEYKTLSEYREAGNLDSYETVDQRAKPKLEEHEVFGKYMDFLESVKIIGRNAAKKPLMVFLYGMNIKAIEIESSISIATDTINLLKGENKDEANKLINELFGTSGVDYSGIDFNQDINEAIGQNISITYEGYSSDTLLNYLAFRMKPISEAYTESMEQTFPAISNYRKMMQNLGMLSFQVFKRRVEKNKALSEAVYLLNYGTREQKEKAIRVLREFTPAVWTFTESSTETAQPIIKTSFKSTGTLQKSKDKSIAESARRIESKYSIVRGGKKFLPSATIFDHAAGAAPVTPTHNTDSEVMSIAQKAILKALNYEIGLLNNYDAIVAHPTLLPKSGQLYNMAFLEASAYHRPADNLYTWFQSNYNKLSESDKKEIQEIKDSNDNPVLASIEESYQLYKSFQTEMGTNVLRDIKTVEQMNGAEGVAYTFTKEDKSRILYQGVKAKSGAKTRVINNIESVLRTLDDGSAQSQHLNGLYENFIKPFISDDLVIEATKGTRAHVGSYNPDREYIHVIEGKDAMSYENLYQTYIHELLHHVTYAGFETNYGLKHEARKLADRMIDAIRKSDLDPKKKRRYIRYIMENPEHEILPWFLTHDELVVLASETPYVREKSDNLFGWILDLMKRVIEHVKRIVYGTKPVKTEYDYMLRLLEKTVRTTQRVRNPSNAMRAMEKRQEGLEKLNEAMKTAIKKKVDDLFGPNPDEVFAEATSAFDRVLEAHTGISLRNNDTLNYLKNAIIGTKGVLADKLGDILRQYTRNIEKHSKDIETATADLIREVLGDEYTDARERNLTKSLLYTDTMALVRAGYDNEQIIAFLRNPEIMEREIDNLMSVVPKTTRDQFDYASDALAWFMMTGENLSPFGFTNAVTMTDFITKGYKINPNRREEIIKAVDLATSLKALRLLKRHEANELESILLNPQFDKIRHVLEAHENYIESNMFDGPRDPNKIKGYSSTMKTNNKELAFVRKPTSDMTKEMRNQLQEELDDTLARGFKVIKENDHFYILQAPTSGAQYMQGVFSTIGTGAKGYKEYMNVEEFAAQRLAFYDRVKSGKKFDPFDTDSSSKPLYQYANGSYIKRFVMTKQELREIMGIEERFSKTVPYSFMRAIRKHKGIELNYTILDVLDEDYNMASDKSKARDFYTIRLKPIWNGNYAEYVEMKKRYDRQPEKFREIAELIPEKVWRDAYNNGMTSIKIRKEMKDVVFGFREWVPQIPRDIRIMGADRHIDLRYLSKANAALRLTDAWIKGIVEIVKTRLVPLNIVVHTGNFLSNSTILWWMGVPLNEIYDAFTNGAIALNDYRKDMDTYMKLHIDGKVNTPEYKLAKKRLKDNPISKAIESGLYSFIVEDVTNELNQRYNIAEDYGKRIIEGASKKMAEAIGASEQERKKMINLLKRIYVTEDTPEGKVMVQAMQYSDFLAKYALQKHLLKMGKSNKEAVDIANELFIDYRWNDTQTLDYLNRVGIFPFSKFAVRIQKAGLTIAKERPLYVAFTLLAGGAIETAQNTVDFVDNIYFNNFGPGMFNNLGFGMNPFDALGAPYSFIFK